MSRPVKAIRICAVLCMVAVGLGGCSGYDVELKGGLFDMVGLSSIGKRPPEPKMKPRNGLVVPPTTASLPQPGTATAPPPGQVAAISGQESWPVDPDQSKEQQKAALAAKHKAFCEQARQRRDSGLTTDLPNGPLGSCEESILRNFTGKGLFEQKAQTQTAQ